MRRGLRGVKPTTGRRARRRRPAPRRRLQCGESQAPASGGATGKPDAARPPRPPPPARVLFDMDGTLTEPMLDFPRIKAEMGIGTPDPRGSTRCRRRRRAAEAILLRHEERAAEASTLNPGCDAAARTREGTPPPHRAHHPQQPPERDDGAPAARALARRAHRARRRPTEAGPAGPAPRPAASWAASTADAWMVGDGQYDIEAAIAAASRASGSATAGRSRSRPSRGGRCGTLMNFPPSCCAAPDDLPTGGCPTFAAGRCPDLLENATHEPHSAIRCCPCSSSSAVPARATRPPPIPPALTAAVSPATGPAVARIGRRSGPRRARRPWRWAPGVQRRGHAEGGGQRRPLQHATRNVWYQQPARARRHARLVRPARRRQPRLPPKRSSTCSTASWLIDRDYKRKTEIKRQVLRPGEKINLLKLGEGPFPLPIGQDKAEVKKLFDVTKEKLLKDDPQGTVHVKLVPKPGTQLRRSSARSTWVDRGTISPAGSTPPTPARTTSARRSSTTSA